jgi:hypothetical protein
MSLKKIGIILFLIFSLLPIQKIFAQSANTGFVSANIWYSKDPFIEGDKIKIYTFVFNPDNRQLSGTVNFFDNTILLGKKDFTVAANATSTISINWTVTAGDHTIFGQIENAKFLLSNGNYETVSLTENQTEKSSRTVSKKITSQSTDTGANSTFTSISDIEKTITEKTPSFITEPIISAVNALEQFRTNINIASDSKKTEVQKEIKALANTTTTPKEEVPQNSILQPLKYVELFFLTISSFILNNKILFYGVLAIIAFLILRFIWNFFF